MLSCGVLYYMEHYMQISKLNDFIFCPRSVYLKSVYDTYEQKTYHRTPQVVGKIKHQTIDQKRYSTSKYILSGTEVYSEKYNLVGKIDIFDRKKGLLVERKYQVKKIYDGYRYQLYAQMFCLQEMGYAVKAIKVHSLVDNKRYAVPMPNEVDIKEFEMLVKTMQTFNAADAPILENSAKCAQCIYKPLCH